MADWAYDRKVSRFDVTRRSSIVRRSTSDRSSHADGLEDLPFVVGHGAQLILIPKVERAEEVAAVAEAAARLAHDAPTPWLMPILESAAGVLAAVLNFT